MPNLPPPQSYKPQQRPNPPSSPAFSPLLHKRRSLIYAAGICIIVISGALAGSELKTKYQASQAQSARVEQITAVQDTSTVEDRSGKRGTAAVTATVKATSAEIEKRNKRQMEVDRRIEGLQGKRAMLVREKGTLEGKIEALRERERDRVEREEARRRANVR